MIFSNWLPYGGSRPAITVKSLDELKGFPEFNPGQPRIPAGMPGAGQWTSAPPQSAQPDQRRTPQNLRWTPTGEPELIQIAQTGNRHGRPYQASLEYDEAFPEAHTLERHAGKTDQELLERLNGMTFRWRFGPAAFRLNSIASTFEDRQQAKYWVNRVLARQSGKVEAWLKSRARRTVRTEIFENDVTGRGAHYRRGRPVVEATRGVVVVLDRDPNHPNGFYVRTAYPTKPFIGD